MTSTPVEVLSWLHMNEEIIVHSVHHCPNSIPRARPRASRNPTLGGKCCTAAVAGLKWSPPAVGGCPGPGCAAQGAGAGLVCIGGAGVHGAGACATSPVPKSNGCAPPKV